MTDAARGRYLAYALGFGAFFQNAILMPVLPRFAQEQLGLTLGAVGVVLAARNLIPSLFAASIGSMGVRIGLRRSIAGASLLMTVAGALYLTADSYWTLMAAQIVGGLLFLVVWVGAQTYATQLPDRERVLGVFSTFTALGLAAGPVAGGIAFDLGGYPLSFWVYILSCIFLAAVGWSLAEGQAGVGIMMKKIGFAEAGGIVRRPGVQTALLFSFISLVSISERSSFVPLYLQQIGYSGSATGLILAVASIGQAASRPFTKEILRKFGLIGTVVAASLVGIMGVTLIPVAGWTLLMGIFAFLHGGGAGLHQSVGLMMVAAHTDRNERAYTLGLRTTVTQVASAMSPFMVGMLADRVGIRSSFFIMAGALGLLTVVLAYSARRTEQYAAELAVSRQE